MFLILPPRLVHSRVTLTIAGHLALGSLPQLNHSRQREDIAKNITTRPHFLTAMLMTNDSTANAFRTR